MKPILTQIILTLEGPVKGWKDEQFHMRNDWMGCVSSAQRRSIMVVCKVIDWNGEGEWGLMFLFAPSGEISGNQIKREEEEMALHTVSNRFVDDLG